jgi:hypothetical protein
LKFYCILSHTFYGHQLILTFLVSTTEPGKILHEGGGLLPLGGVESTGAYKDNF